MFLSNISRLVTRSSHNAVKKLPWEHFGFSSKYSQRMRKLSCKIFNEFYIPELTRKELEYSRWHTPVAQWSQKWHGDLRTFERQSERPIDLNPEKNWNYYPAHPQIKDLTLTLREYGLYRDEHLDFNEEMEAKALAKGKIPWKQRERKNKK